MIIGLGHRKQVGKDTIAQFLVDECGFQRRAFADLLKEVALGADPLVHSCVTVGFDVDEWRLSRVVNDLGYDRAKTSPVCGDEVRGFLQRLGVAVRDHLGPDVWRDAVLNNLPEGDVVITDVRFPNEFEGIKELGGHLVRVVRPGLPEAEDTHISETALEDAPWDFAVINNGTLDDLRVEAGRLYWLLSARRQNV